MITADYRLMMEHADEILVGLNLLMKAAKVEKGYIGIETFTPIINQPDSVIVGVCAIEDELQMDDEGKLSKHQVMRLSVTLDHRTLDGAVVAKFEMDLRDILQNPMSIVL